MHEYDSFTSIGDPSVVCRHVSKSFRSFSSKRNLKFKKVQAVKDVSFAVTKGESVGILGQNGSGKSTLLQMIAGNDSPTSGNIFASAHPTLLGVRSVLIQTLSGAKNLKLACLALGMKESEFYEVYPKLVDLIDIGDAIYRPLNTYSSGMAARLNFAIGTASSPEILIVDEALSTGDAAFTARAGDRMEKMLQAAGTLFLVSHAAKQVEEMCSRALWLDGGKVIADGDSASVSDLYRKWIKFRVEEKFDAADGYLEEVAASYIAPKILFESEVGGDSL